MNELQILSMRDEIEKIALSKELAEAGKKAGLTPEQIDLWPTNMVQGQRKRPFIGRLLTGKKMVSLRVPQPISLQKYKSYLKRGGDPEKYFEKVSGGQY